MKNGEPQNIIDIWPVIQEDFKKFMSDRPGWFIDALEKARNNRVNDGWEDVEKVVQILQFLKDTEIEYY